MSFLSNLGSFFHTTEADVISFVSKVWAEAPVVESEIVKVSNWVIGEIPTVTAAIAAATPIVDAVGGVADPTLSVKMAALNAAMAGLNAFAVSAQNKSLTADQVVQGYSSLKNATAAASSLVSSAATIVALTPASGPSK
jgi:hypothetical protein